MHQNKLPFMFDKTKLNDIEEIVKSMRTGIDEFKKE